MKEGGEYYPNQAAETGVARKLEPPLRMQPRVPDVRDYIEVLDEGLGRPWRTPTNEGFQWFLADAIGLDADQMSDDEAKMMAWMASWDHWTVQTLGQLIQRARAQAYAEGHAAGHEASS